MTLKGVPLGGDEVMSTEPLMNGINTLEKESPESSLALFVLCEDTVKKWLSMNQEAILLADTKSARVLILVFPVPRTMRNKSLFLKPPTL